MEEHVKYNEEVRKAKKQRVIGEITSKEDAILEAHKSAIYWPIGFFVTLQIIATFILTGYEAMGNQPVSALTFTLISAGLAVLSYYLTKGTAKYEYILSRDAYLDAAESWGNLKHEDEKQ